MPVPIIAQVFEEGLSDWPWLWTLFKTAPWVLLIAALKYYFGGARNPSERNMHSKVVLMTVSCPLFPTLHFRILYEKESSCL